MDHRSRPSSAHQIEKNLRFVCKKPIFSEVGRARSVFHLLIFKCPTLSAHFTKTMCFTEQNVILGGPKGGPQPAEALGPPKPWRKTMIFIFIRFFTFLRSKGCPFQVFAGSFCFSLVVACGGCFWLLFLAVGPGSCSGLPSSEPPSAVAFRGRRG